MDNLKNQLTAAVAMSAAALVASGYLITWARLLRVEAPPRAVLPALPTTYYLGVALESLLLLVVVLLVVGVGFLFAQIMTRTRRAVNEWPSHKSWLVLGLLVAAVALLLGGGFVSSVFSTDTRGSYVPAMLVVATLVVILAMAISVAGDQLRLAGAGATAAAILVLATAAAIGFKLTDAWLGEIAFPKAAALTSREACETPDAEILPKGCGFGGFYIGEDSAWIYLVQTPLVCSGEETDDPGRLILVPRAEPLDVAISAELPSKKATCGSHDRDYGTRPPSEGPNGKAPNSGVAP